MNSKVVNKTITLTGTAMLSAVAFVLMYIEIPLPMLIPSFIKFDISDFPAIVASATFGPISGVCVCLLKNFLHLIFASNSGGIGELGNFIMGAVLVLPVGVVTQFKQTQKAIVLSGLLGAVIMGFASVPINYFMLYPFYYNFMPEEVVLEAYQAILPSVDSIMSCLFIFNLPFTMIKGFVSVLFFVPFYPFIKNKILKRREKDYENS